MEEELRSKLNSIEETVLREALEEQLAPRERELIELFLGISGGEKYTISDLSKKYNVLEDRIVQIIRKATRKLQGSPRRGCTIVLHKNIKIAEDRRAIHDMDNTMKTDEKISSSKPYYEKTLEEMTAEDRLLMRIFEPEKMDKLEKEDFYRRHPREKRRHEMESVEDRIREKAHRLCNSVALHKEYDNEPGYPVITPIGILYLDREEAMHYYDFKEEIDKDLKETYYILVTLGEEDGDEPTEVSKMIRREKTAEYLRRNPAFGEDFLNTLKRFAEFVEEDEKRRPEFYKNL